MIHSGIIKILMAGVLALLVMPVSARAEHLLFSEIGVETVKRNEGYKSSEYFEIYNPTTSSVSLDNYFYTDSNLYRTLPANPGGMALGTSDQITRFPAGSVLAPGQVAVVTGGADLFLKEFFPSDANPELGDIARFHALPGSPLLFEVEETMPNVPNMMNFNTAPEVTDDGKVYKNNLSMTNVGEFSILFHWDGASELVQDVDIIAWGVPEYTSNRFSPKTSSDTGASGATYQYDAGNHDSLTVSADAIIVRTSISETDEVETGGNGIMGHDETTENTPLTWAAKAITEASPGVTDLGDVQPQQLDPVD